MAARAVDREFIYRELGDLFPLPATTTAETTASATTTTTTYNYKAPTAPCTRHPQPKPHCTGSLVGNTVQATL